LPGSLRYRSHVSPKGYLPCETGTKLGLVGGGEKSDYNSSMWYIMGSRAG